MFYKSAVIHKMFEMICHSLILNLELLTFRCIWAFPTYILRPRHDLNDKLLFDSSTHRMSVSLLGHVFSCLFCNILGAERVFLDLELSLCFLFILGM